MCKLIDLDPGQHFGRLTVVERQRIRYFLTDTAVLALRGKIHADNVMIMISIFCFGTQHEKK